MADNTVSPAEVARFGGLAAQWWDPSGPMRPLHQMNPTRIAWITERIGRRFPHLTGLRVLDVGCGAGLAAEAMAQHGFEVLGLDASEPAIEAARAHAKSAGLPVVYRTGVAEDVAIESLRFPVITALEVIEHVPDAHAFLRVLVGLMEPGGLLFLSTLNRTARSLVTAKLGAEYVLRLLPVATHDWRRFITPVELADALRGAGARINASTGLVPDPTAGRWRIGRDLGVNYIVCATTA
jgi:2-polyprenyl-6-hydroxyphenyl methylase/3-demethylubiquinone-9 3-methyltransferase